MVNNLETWRKVLRNPRYTKRVSHEEKDFHHDVTNDTQGSLTKEMENVAFILAFGTRAYVIAPSLNGKTFLAYFSAFLGYV